MAQLYIENPRAEGFHTSGGTKDHLVPPHAYVKLSEPSFRIEFDFTDLDALNDLIEMFGEARAALLAQIFEWRGQRVEAIALERGNEVLFDDDHCHVEQVVISGHDVTLTMTDTAGDEINATVARAREFVRLAPRLTSIQ